MEICSEHRFDSEDFQWCPFCEITRLNALIAELEGERDRLRVECEAWRKDDDLAADREWVTP